MFAVIFTFMMSDGAMGEAVDNARFTTLALCEAARPRVVADFKDTLLRHPLALTFTASRCALDSDLDSTPL
jgi:hypothetical protein